ncbi:MAG: hypothetical protein ISS25_01985 [Nanoarchaeota archaeon]|nr:hypothetical protein [DPANN group archaeon]MBL7116576.1 hypothetical protein [Nanoarchaeota archaeon]
MKVKEIIILLVSLLLLTYGLSFLYYTYFKVVDVKSLPYYFSVQHHIGLVGDRDAVKFGGVMPGETGKRWLHLMNNLDFPVKVNIKIKGEKSDWITIEENNFILEPNTYNNVSIIVQVPEYAEQHTNYTGKVTAYYLKT